MSHDAQEVISAITIKGFKSLSRETQVAVRPLTVLAGANSSGKSSAIQPLLLLKQTLEATFDPGTLLISGPNVSFSSREQLLSTGADEFGVGVETDLGRTLHSHFKKHSPNGFLNAQMSYSFGDESLILTPGMESPLVRESIRQLLETRSKGVDSGENDSWGTVYRILLGLMSDQAERSEWQVVRRRCFLVASSPRNVAFSTIVDLSPIESALEGLIHVPALRGNPSRGYRTSAIGSRFPGRFDDYVASVVRNWQDASDDRLTRLEQSLDLLQLAWKIEAVPIDDVQVDLRVPLSPKRSARRALEMVSVADVGFGLSQALPVVMALIAAQPGQMVFVEQPEIHLHPRAQTKLAEVLVAAANRGVRVVAETHSENLLLGIQTCVAEGKISPADVKLHWFSRGKDGVTRIDSADLDESGAFGDWPEDFADVSLSAQRRYLDAVEKRLGISSK